ncbi:MAG: hypothetical protein WCE48_10745, partial [Steroidobacteraceae bacterium]
MRAISTQASLMRSGLAAAVLLLAGGLAHAQTVAQVNLTASAQSATLPDGRVVPMWGLSCTTVTAQTLNNATASVTVTGGAITGLGVTNGGAGYVTAPKVTFIDGAGVGAAATAIINSAGQVTGFTITSGGAGYTATTASLTPSPTSFATGGGTCTAANGVVQTGGRTWQPPVITIPYTSTAGLSTTTLTINLTNNLSNTADPTTFATGVAI